MKDKTRERARELREIFEPFIILVGIEEARDGYLYKLSEDATPEAIEADKEFRTFAKDLPPIR